MEKRRKTVKIAAILLLVVFAAVFLLYQFFHAGKYSVKTVTALRTDIYDTVETTIYAVRKESVITSTVGGFVVPLIKNGDRAANGDTIAAVFSGEAAAQSYAAYLKAQDEITYYTRLSGSSLAQYADVDKLTSDTYQAIYEMSAAVHAGDFAQVSAQALALRSAITSGQNAAGASYDYSDTIASLYSQSAASLSAAGQYSSVIASESGYYISACDGYENLVSYDDVASMDVAAIDQAIARPPVETAQSTMGKLINSFDWYFVCNIDAAAAGRLSVGRRYTVELPYSSADDFRAEVYKINDTVDGRTAVVFRVTAINAPLASIRTAYASIRLKSYSGYRIPNSAIRIVDGERGVYILRNNLVNFRRIDILYSDDTYSIVDNVDGQSYYIKLYDEVITEGTDLYDGKLVG